MDLETARRHIRTYLDRMRGSASVPVFDEWAILALSKKAGAVLAYSGPRPEAFGRNVTADSEILRKRTAGKSIAEGDIEFATDAVGTQYDAFMRVGASSFLILNHTAKTLDEIRADPKWLAVQAALFELSEKFREDPLKT